MSNSYFSNFIRNTQHLALEAQTSQTSSQWDDDSVLDDNILESALDSSAFDMSPIDTRRTSMADMAIFSPHVQASDWDFDHELGSLERHSPLMATFDNNAFPVKMEGNISQFAGLGNWSTNTDEPSGSCTPVQYNGQQNGYQSGEFDAINFSSFATPASFENAQSHPSMTSVNVYQASAPNGLSIPSTPMTNEWPAPLESQVEVRTIASNGLKRMRPGSPIPRTHSPLHIRRDGIRKKNARFEIPAERTLLNIDHLIAQSADDSEIKELKQQKRLLRNRQAALDSRQRKKQHTERLEEDKKVHSHMICELNDKIAAMAIREDEIQRRELEIRQERDVMEHHLRYNQIQNEELVRKHTLETGELRKKNAFLVQQLEEMQQKLEEAQLNMATPTPGTFTSEFNFDGMGMDTSFWDEPPTFANEPNSFGSIAARVVENPVMDVKKESVIDVKEEEKPAASGLLFLLLLFGAFVASSQTTTSSSLPPIPGALRTASAAVLNTIFEDAGVKPTSTIAPSQTSLQISSAVSQHVSDSWVVPKAEQSQMVGLESSLAMLSARLEHPTRQQEQEQLMMLTAAEYNEVTSKEFLREPEDTTSLGRMHLQETLNKLRGHNNNKVSAAEVYTRSLLWDKVDAEVVRRFAAFAQLAATTEHANSDCDSAYDVEVI